jgi:hypothetical protein
MDDDFNSAGALGYLFELVRVINQARADGATDEQLKSAQDVLEELSGVLGLRLRVEKESHAADAFVDLLGEVRQDVRQAKLWRAFRQDPRPPGRHGRAGGRRPNPAAPGFGMKEWITGRNPVYECLRANRRHFFRL